ncbi:MAG: hypothetical protein IJN78_06445 [Clostridia bacterium]|nr:hypothetical protein [Clostridia bacterium]
MKNTLRKRTFISAIAMLLVSAIVLTSSTFAWFSMAKRVEVEKMQLNITSPDGVQISANTDAFTTTLTMADFVDSEATTRWKAYTGHTNHFPELLRPSSSNLEVSRSLPKFFEGSISDTGILSIKQAEDTTGGYVVFDLFVKVGKNETVWWNESTVTCEANPEVETAMRIGLVNCGVVEEKATSDVISSTLPVAATNNRSVMYEIDSTNHTAASGFSAGATVDKLYIWAERDNASMPAGKTYTNDAYAARALSSNVALATEKNVDDVAYINAAAGINRIRVYLWMEGNDVDCANDVAGATIDFNLVLTLK